MLIVRMMLIVEDINQHLNGKLVDNITHNTNWVVVGLQIKTQTLKLKSQVNVKNQQNVSVKKIQMQMVIEGYMTMVECKY